MSYQREFQRKIRVGVVGVGSHAYRNILPVLTFLPVKLDAICDVHQARLVETAAQYGVSKCYADAAEMFSDAGLEAVLLSVGPFAHPQLAGQALAAGLHVWMEKPPAARVSEVDEIICKRGDRVVAVGFKKVCMPCMRKAKEIVSSQDAGTLKSMLVEYSVTLPENGRAALESRQMTSWLGNGCHPLSAMVYMGGRVATVTTARAKSGGGVCVLEFASGAIGTLHLAEGMKGPCERYSFYTDNYHVVIENCLKVTVHRGVPFIYGKSTDYMASGMDSGSVSWEPQNGLATLENKALFTQGFFNELNHFCECILKGSKAETGTLEFAREVMMVYEAALLSAGRPVAIT